MIEIQRIYFVGILSLGRYVVITPLNCRLETPDL